MPDSIVLGTRTSHNSDKPRGRNINVLPDREHAVEILQSLGETTFENSKNPLA